MHRRNSQVRPQNNVSRINVPMEQDLKVKVSKYMSYLLRHNPESMKMDRHGFVGLDEFLDEVRGRFQVDKKFIFEVVERSERKRFEIVEDTIRALYGHTIPVQLELEEDKTVKVLYHGTTNDAVSKILKVGLKAMKRRWAHLSPTIEIATDIGLRRSKEPVVLEIDTEAARKNGTRFLRATNTVYLCSHIRPEHIKRVPKR